MGIVPKDLNRRELLDAYGQILLGSLIGAAAYPTFLVPNSIAPGGLTGVATILNYVSGWPVGITDCAIIRMMAAKNNSMSSLVLIFHGKGIYKK